jgi:hypothetical protein
MAKKYKFLIVQNKFIQEKGNISGCLTIGNEKKEFGTRAFIVEDVAHHMPSEKMEGTYDNIIVYCTPIKKDADK